MSAPDPSLPPWAEPYLPGFLDLLHLIDLSGGFVLVPLSIPGPDVAVALGEWLSTKGHPAFVIQPQDDVAWEHLAASLLAAKPAKGGVVMVIGSSEPPPGSYLGMRLVNEHRDSLVRHLGCPLLWCGPTSFLDFTWERAPDFWSIRSVDRQLEAAEAEVVLESEKDESSPVRKDSTSSDWMAEAKEQGDTASAARLALKRVDKLIEEGAFAEAAAVVSEALESLGADEPRLRVELGLRQADLARRAGALKSALRILEDLKPQARKPTQVGRICLAKARVLEAMKMFDAAIEAYQAALGEARPLGDLALEARATLRLSSLLAKFKHTPKPTWATAQGREVAKHLGDAALGAMAAAFEAILAAAEYDRARAHALLTEAHALRETSRGALTSLDAGELDEALEAADKAVKGSASPRTSSRSLAESFSPHAKEGPCSSPHAKERPCDPPALGQAFDADYYVHREKQERIALNALQHPGSPVFLWGPDLFGKSTLLGYLTEVLRGSGSAQVAYVNLQTMVQPQRRPFEEHLIRFGDGLATLLNAPPVSWDGLGSSRRKLAEWMEDRILPAARDRFVLILDGTEAVQEASFKDEFFTMLRAWSERDGKSAWTRFRLVLASNLTPDALTQSEDISPFSNLVTAIELGELSEHQAADLAERYQVTTTREQLTRLDSLVAGHPYLLCVALCAAGNRSGSLGDLLDDGAALAEVFGAHLEHLRRRVAADHDLRKGLHQLVSRPSSRLDKYAYERLRSTGLIVRERGAVKGYRFRCALYEDYFRSQGLE